MEDLTNFPRALVLTLIKTGRGNHEYDWRSHLGLRFAFLRHEEKDKICIGEGLFIFHQPANIPAGYQGLAFDGIINKRLWFHDPDCRCPDPNSCNHDGGFKVSKFE